MKKFSFENNLPNNNWKKIILSSFDQGKRLKIENNINKKDFKNLCPSVENIFKAFELTDFDNVNVVILGQDPYHGPNQAHGLSFSVPEGVKIPPSLKNIFKLIQKDLNIEMPNSGNLTEWSKQGVLLLNTSLTVDLGKPMSHKDVGWSDFTEFVISQINEKLSDVVFMAWGLSAQKILESIDGRKHLILSSVHPSPLSAYRGFFDSKHFKLCNDFLNKKNKKIDWSLAE